MAVSVSLSAVLVAVLVVSATSASAAEQEAGGRGIPDDACETVVRTVRKCCAEKDGFFMKKRSVCCKSFAELENYVRDGVFSAMTVCNCIKKSVDSGSKDDVKDIDNEDVRALVEVRALCAPSLPFPLSAGSDCFEEIGILRRGIAAEKRTQVS